MRLPISLVRVAFNALYGPFAWAYDAVSSLFFLGQWRYWQQASLPLARGSVLEIGFGTGVLVERAAREGRQWTGLERSSAMIRQTRKRLDGRYAPVVQGDVARLPFASASFDTIVSTFPTEYIFDSGVLSELGRILRSEGRILVVPGATLRPGGVIDRALDAFNSVVSGEVERALLPPGPAGFHWTAEWVESPRGRCLLYQGSRQEDQVETSKGIAK